MKYKNPLRSLHRDLGYFFIGITIIYAITGFILSTRGLGWFMEKHTFTTTIEKNVKIEDIRDRVFININQNNILNQYDKEFQDLVKEKIKRVLFKKRENDIYHFGTRGLRIQYNVNNGVTEIKYRGYYLFLEKFISAHKTKNDTAWFYISLIYSIVLAFFAISSIFMIKGKYGFKKRGVYLFTLGIATISIFLYIL